MAQTIIARQAMTSTSPIAPVTLMGQSLCVRTGRNAALAIRSRARAPVRAAGDHLMSHRDTGAALADIIRAQRPPRLRAL
jgi:hypothetical protein